MTASSRASRERPARPTRRARPRSASALTPLPAGRGDIAGIAELCRKRVSRRALLSAGAAVVPIPGLDVMVDVGVLTRMLQEINEAFGLTPAQIEALSSRRRLTVYRAIETLGATAVGRVITREVVALVARSVLRRIATRTALRYVPLAGQALAAGLSYAALKTLGDRHIEDCVRVATQAVDIH